MPLGSLSVFPEIIRLALLNNPKKILDVGIGYGVNGAGIRNWFNDATKRNIELVGIEPHEAYRNPNWDHYDAVMLQSLEETNVVQMVGYYDLIICTDVCEHWTLHLVEPNVNKLKSWLKPDGVILMSTPAVWIEQGAYEGNEYERHHTMWTHELFQRHGFTVLRDATYQDPLGHCMFIAEYLNR